MKRILMAVETLSAGGAELFSLRLARELSKTNKVVFFCLNKNIVDWAQLKQFERSFHLVSPSPLLFDFLFKLDHFLGKFGIKSNLAERITIGKLKRVIKKYSIECVHSHLFRTDYIVAKTLEKHNRALNHVVTIHGDYMTFWKKASNNEYIYNLANYKNKLKYTLQQINTIVCIGEHQIEFFKGLEEKFGLDLKLIKIYNGYSNSQPKKSTERAKFTFGMVSRGIPEKGWHLSIEAFIAMSKPDTELILVGGSDYLNRLEDQYKSYNNILFTGHSANPVEWISQFDVGLLPSTYPSESLPTVVIEYLFCGKPIIASDVGEIRNMITEKNKKAGLLVAVEENKIPVEQLVKKMLLY